VNLQTANPEFVIEGRFIKTCRPRHEWYEFVQDPGAFLSSDVSADLVTFMEEPFRNGGEWKPQCSYYVEADPIAAVPVTSYDHWLKKQINDKTRNMVRKAAKSGVELRLVDFNDEFVQGVMGIYNESPVRQGRRFWHYGKDLETNKRELGTFPDRSYFVGAFHCGEMIGFSKLTRNTYSASLMFIISKMAHRNKACSNALLAKAVEMCAEMRIPYLQYGSWSRGGLGDFKIKHGLTRFDVPRYFVPRTLLGRVALRLRLHRKLTAWLPEKMLDQVLALRGAWYSARYEKAQARAAESLN
jgi:hypothetical protein